MSLVPYIPPLKTDYILSQITKFANNLSKNIILITYKKTETFLSLFFLKYKGLLFIVCIHFYPRATSSIIIITKPIATPIVAKFECSPSCASGINSSTTT